MGHSFLLYEGPVYLAIFATPSSSELNFGHTPFGHPQFSIRDYQSMGGGGNGRNNYYTHHLNVSTIEHQARRLEASRLGLGRARARARAGLSQLVHVLSLLNHCFTDISTISAIPLFLPAQKAQD